MKTNAADTTGRSITEFYTNRSIFITGASGFLGKVLIEKLLRSCPDIAEIFLLIRPKKGLSVEERLKKVLDNKLFDKLRTERPSSFNKLVPIIGDAAVEGLGLLPADRQMLIERVSVVFHVAASVRFDESLKDAIFNNTRSTRDVCILAESMKKLVTLLHVSSTYTQIDKRVVDEILYPSEVDWRQTIKIAESVDEHVLRTLTAKYMGSMPNTYTFTKRLAEQVINDYSKSLPCVIFRPSIVISTVTEPVKGWLDNFNGPIGMLVGGGKGILRVVYVDPNIVSDYMPVDVAIKVMIITAWKRGIETIVEDSTIHVYNCSSCTIKQLDTKQIVKLGFRIVQDVPLEGIIWSPRTTLTKNISVYYILMLLLHILPAIVIDAIMKLIGSRPILLKLQRKVYVTNSALSHFLLNEWQFRNEKLLDLLDNLEDINQDFGFDYKNFDIVDYFKDGIIGTKLYLLKEDMNQLEKARSHRKRMDWIDRIIKGSFFIIIAVWILYRNNMF